MNKNLVSIEFHPDDTGGQSKFVGSVSLQELITRDETQISLSSRTKRASKKYEQCLTQCKRILSRIGRYSSANQAPLRNMWSLGDKIHRLAKSLQKDGFYLNGLYDHLTRDLNVSRDLLERIVVFQSHLENRNLIPENMIWKDVRYAPGKNAKKLSQGVSLKESQKKGNLH